MNVYELLVGIFCLFQNRILYLAFKLLRQLFQGKSKNNRLTTK